MLYFAFVWNCLISELRVVIQSYLSVSRVLDMILFTSEWMDNRIA